MHKYQLKILELLQTSFQEDVSLRALGEKMGIPNQPQKVKHHLDQLRKRGLLKIKKENGRIKKIELIKSGSINNKSLRRLPIYGAANCGEAVTFADAGMLGYLYISSKLLFCKSNKLFVVKAVGNSMNKAKVGKDKQSIENGDYVVVDPDRKNTIEDGQYILSIIDRMANIKKVIKNINDNSKQLVLVSESTDDYPPIYIDYGEGADDVDYVVNGSVCQVLKNPKKV